MSEQKPLRDYQRMWDLVRQMRMELHNADLITDDEYAALAVDHPAVARLESYDELRSKLQKEIAAHAETLKRAARMEILHRRTDESRVWHFQKAEEARKQLAETREQLKQARTICSDLYAALYGVAPYREHNRHCEIGQTDFCTCGMAVASGKVSSAMAKYDGALRAKPEPEQPKPVCVFCDCEVCECGY